MRRGYRQGLLRLLHLAVPHYLKGISYHIGWRTRPASTGSHMLQHSFSLIPETDSPLQSNLPVLSQLRCLSHTLCLVLPCSIPPSQILWPGWWLPFLALGNSHISTTQHMLSYRACVFCLHPIWRIRCFIYVGCRWLRKVDSITCLFWRWPNISKNNFLVSFKLAQQFGLVHYS